MAANAIEEAVLAALRLLPIDKQKEVPDFESFLDSKERRPLDFF